VASFRHGRALRVHRETTSSCRRRRPLSWPGLLWPWSGLLCRA